VNYVPQGQPSVREPQGLLQLTFGQLVRPTLQLPPVVVSALAMDGFEKKSKPASAKIDTTPQNWRT